MPNFVVRGLCILNLNLIKSRFPITDFLFTQLFSQSCTEHSSDNTVLCAKFQNDWITETGLMDEQDLARFEFKTRFFRLSYIAQPFDNSLKHDDVIKWKHFPLYWPGPLCGEFIGPGKFPAQKPVTRSFDVFFDLCLNKRLSKQS